MLKVFSQNSVRKETVLLQELYAKAGVTKYWLADVREGRLAFTILPWTREGYVEPPSADGWLASKVLGKSFQSRRKMDPRGRSQFEVGVA